MHATKFAMHPMKPAMCRGQPAGKPRTFTGISRTLTGYFAHRVRHSLTLVAGCCLLLLGLVLAGAAFAQQPPVRDKEYKLINPPQKTTSGKKIEVVEFFSYACGHCADFEPILQDWIKSRPQDVEVKMVPMVFRDNWKPLAKLYYSLETMGVLSKHHQAVYDAIHKQKQALFSDSAIIDWAAKRGIDKRKFEQVYHSFGVDAKVLRGMSMGRAYGVQFTPSMAINGKYWTGPSMVLSPDGGPDIGRYLQVLEQLIAMERGRGAALAKDSKSTL
jgi:thiol:disulfide interchange protein DsbA